MSVNHDEQLLNLTNSLNNLQLHQESETNRSESCIVEINSLKAELNTLNQRFVFLQQQFANMPTPPPASSPVYQDVGVMSHASFSGNPKELGRFLYFVKDRLVEAGHRFPTEKSKINWVVRHFCYANGNISDQTPVYNWWISILKENARSQNFPTHDASTEDPYGLPCLLTIGSFLTKLSEVYADRNSVQDAKVALRNCRQGNLSVDNFNSIFSSLVYAVDLTEESRCDIYKRALNPRILEIALMRFDWNSAVDLRAKQELAVQASNLLDELNLLRRNVSQRPTQQLPSPPPPQQAPTQVPMDLDAMTGGTGFTFPAYRLLCIKAKICQRCHNNYDQAHITSRSCPNKEVLIKDKVAKFVSLSQNPQLAAINVSAVNFNPQPQSWDNLVDVTGGGNFADMMMFGHEEFDFQAEQGLSHLPIFSISPLPPTSSRSYSAPVIPSRLIIPVRLLTLGGTWITAKALVDSGAGGSFIDTTFVRENKLTLTRLSSSFTCRSFDGSPASSGDVTHSWNGRIACQDHRQHPSFSSASFFVVSLSSVDIILGLPWLKANFAWVGGPHGQLSFSPPSNHTRISSTTAPPVSLSSITNNVVLTKDEILSLPAQLRSFSDVFTIASLQSLPPVRPQFDLNIKIKPGCTPPFGGLYNLSESERRQLRTYIDENLAKGYIRLSSSPAAAPIFFVKTEGKDDRPCVDYRGLNGMTVRDSYPIPVLSLLLNNLAGCKYLSKVDLKSAFNLLRVTPGQEYLTAFRTPWGLYEYTVMPFGLANAPATFQRFIQYVLREYIDVCCFVYIDDILIFSKTEEEHIQHLKNILTKLRDYSLKASLKKCQFFQTQVQFLGFIISSSGLRMDPQKLDTILKWPLPRTLKGLRCFLGFCNFYRRFIPRFSTITNELTQLTKISAFNPKSMDLEGPRLAFSQLLEAFTSAPLLSHFSFTADRVVHVDSSGFAIAGVLSQPDNTGKLHPVSFFSRKLTDQEKVWPIFDLELLAVISAFEEWRAWLAGTKNPVLVFSDHANLRYFMTSKTLTPKQARWAAYLDSFNFRLIHVSGTANPADAPSRRPDLGEGETSPIPNSLTPKFHINAIETGTHAKPEHDLYFQPLSSTFSSLIKTTYPTLTEEEKEEYHFDKDLYWFRHRVFAPLQCREQIIKAYHEGPIIGHPGIARTLSLILRTFDWPSIRKDVIAFVSSCDSCQRVKSARQAPIGTLQPFPVPSRPWDVIGMDFITKLPKSKGHDSILVVIDHLSKASHFIPCKESMTSAELAKLFRREIFRLHGFPDRIISDRGPTFTSKFWLAFMKSLNIKAATSTAYHPQTDGQTERMNQVLEDYLRHFVNYHQTDWAERLDLAEFSLNNMHSSSSGVSPFFFVHGFHPRFNTLTTPSGTSSVDKVVKDLQEIQEKAQLSIIAAKEKQAYYYDQHRRPTPTYQPGDLVMLTRKFIQTRRPNSKLDYRHLGPFSVIKMVGERAVHLDIAEHYPLLHPVFNVALLIPYKDPSSNVHRTSDPVFPPNHSAPVAKIDWKFFGEVLDYRSRRKGSDEYLIRWIHSTPAHDRWLHLVAIPQEHHHTLIQFHQANNLPIPLLLTGRFSDNGYRLQTMVPILIPLEMCFSLN
ncbi:hypothetical protein MJO28_013719 [Puccinia striiformis f. sp. tritici]|uniref:Uncharacterized protein n=1 Tax=Puccinia striiformis f. sp. tritici TaxID=168172 RepID=A0ACC0DV98_9BASI|nr:hypothetical protein MJO28_013719 [Puccinia striiformis f. sp. tritici]